MALKPETAEKILIVDDEQAVRAVLQRNIDRIGCTSFIACDGQAGLEAAGNVDPAVIVLDLRMPKMDGHTFMRRFQALSLDSAIIVTSADGEMDDVIEAMRHGAVDYLRKPFSNGDIQAALVRALEIHDKRRSGSSITSPNENPSLSSPPPSVEETVAVSSGFAQLLEKIQKGEIVLPSVPQVIDELRTTIANQEATVESVARLVACDQALATRALQVGRSAWYSGATPPLDIAAVIARVGFEKVQALAETIWLNGCFQVPDPKYAAIFLRQARFGLARAVAMRALALALKLDANIAYFSGLFADVGASFLLYVIVEKTTGGLPDLASCREFVRQHHEQIGAQLLTKWGYREELVRHARTHHAQPRDPYAKLFVLGTEAARALTGDDDLTGDGTTSPIFERCTTELKLEARTRDRIFEIAAAELGAIEAGLA